MQTRKQVVQLAVVLLALTAVIVTVGYTVRKKRGNSSAGRLNFTRTPERLARGRYIVEGPAHCFQCHSETDYSRPGTQPKPGKKGAGAIFPEENLPWLVAPNITPDIETGAGSWTGSGSDRVALTRSLPLPVLTRSLPLPVLTSPLVTTSRYPPGRPRDLSRDGLPLSILFNPNIDVAAQSDSAIFTMPNSGGPNQSCLAIDLYSH
jgi:hypothetical protein